MSANPELPVDAERWRLSDGALRSDGKWRERRRKADYLGQVEDVRELWNRTNRTKDDRAALVADLTVEWEITRGEARELVRHAELFQREAVREVAAEALLSRQHLVVMDKTLAEAPEPDREKVEAALVRYAATLDLGQFKDVAQRILVLLDQDGKAPDDRESAQPKRTLTIRKRRNGGDIDGFLDLESLALLEALISPLAKPTSAEDTRTTAERQGDALVEILELAAGCKDLPEEGGEKPHIALTMSWTDFQEQRGTADLAGMGPLNAASVRRIACDSTILRVVLGARSEVLDIGRASRTIPNAIRRALIIRDKGCAFPGCGRKPRQCHAHHVVEWADGGPTSLDNLVLLCSACHRLIHHSDWTVEINDGLPKFGRRAMQGEQGAA
ncbi:DUF222 domain-containing protein [Kutzneria sp. NPDC052558]|uniref:HNH endonuclease signature motif containing protein n=1 Tax=Kutzneria sp. NPDC052558 TaxID=3364121 RepID=UPI0037CB3295